MVALTPAADAALSRPILPDAIVHDFTLSPEGEARHAKLQKVWANPDSYEPDAEEETAYRAQLRTSLSFLFLAFGLGCLATAVAVYMGWL